MVVFPVCVVAAVEKGGSVVVNVMWVVVGSRVVSEVVDVAETVVFLGAIDDMPGEVEGVSVMRVSLPVSLIRVSFISVELIVSKAIVVGVLSVAVTSVEADTLCVGS